MSWVGIANVELMTPKSWANIVYDLDCIPDVGISEAFLERLRSPATPCLRAVFYSGGLSASSVCVLCEIYSDHSSIRLLLPVNLVS